MLKQRAKYPPQIALTDIISFDKKEVEKIAKTKLEELEKERVKYEKIAEIKERVSYLILARSNKYTPLWFKAEMYLYSLEDKRLKTEMWKNYWVRFLTIDKKISIQTNDIDSLRKIRVETLVTTPIREISGRLTTPCPFHNPNHEKEKSISFIIYPNDNSWHCFSCGSHGKGAIDFVMERDGVDFKEAIEILK